MVHKKSAAASKVRSTRGFTLVELLVVVVIVLIVAAAVIPAVISTLSNRELSESARILQAALTGARDAAIRANQPCGIRLLPDVVLTDPPLGTTGQGMKVLAYSRIQQLELAPDYNSGRVTIGPMVTPGAIGSMPGTFPTAYPNLNGGVYPYPDANSGIQQVLMVEESPFVGGYIVGGGAVTRNEPTSWYWNIRIGDKIRINDTGGYYTIVGPCTINPITFPGQNPELFVNVGNPGDMFGAWTTPLLRTYYLDNLGNLGMPPLQWSPEFLFVVNGVDDGTPATPTTAATQTPDGYVDNGFDGFNNNRELNLVTDEVQTTAPIVSEWEQERWLGSAAGITLADIPGTPSTFSPSPPWISTFSSVALHDKPYTIVRQPVPNEAARETSLPSGMVIDATTWNTTQERSRLPVNSSSLYCDIMINANGQVVPTTTYSTPTSNPSSQTFYHFWLSKRTDVVAPMDQSKAGPLYQLPMPRGTFGYPAAGDAAPRFTEGQMGLMSLYPRSGLILSNSVDQAVEIDTTAHIFSSGFLGDTAIAKGGNVNQPFFDAQQGFNAAK